MVCFGSREMCVGVGLVAHLTLCLVAPITLWRVERAEAQDEQPLPAEYEAAINGALEDHEAGRYEAARAHFQRAHEVFPNARTLRGLGKVEFELRNYVGALRYLQDALESQVRPLPDDLRAEVGGLVERARDFVGELTVEVRPDSAQISVDGSTAALGPRASFTLGEGAHVLDVQASGRLAQRRRIEVHGRDQLQLTVELLTIEPPAPVVQLRELPAAAPPRDVPLRKKWWVWTVSGVAVAGAATAAVLLATRDREHTLPVKPGADWTVANP